MQAVVLVGGKASRLRADGVSVPVSKAFMQLYKKPLLYWNLINLYKAGVRHLVIVGNEVRCLFEASKIVKRLAYRFQEVIYFCDEGQGVHGIPYELRYLLHDTYIIECGHGLSEPVHYKKLVQAKRGGVVVFSGYKVLTANIRQPVILRHGTVQVTDVPGEAIAHPIVADKLYACVLLRLGFNIHAILEHYSQKRLLKYIKNTLPPEYDIKAEMIKAYREYSRYISKKMLP